MKLYGFPLRLGVLIAANIEFIAAAINMIISASWAGDQNYCRHYRPRYEPCKRYRVYVALAVISSWIIISDLLLIYGAFKKNQKIIRYSIPLQIVNSLANLAVLGVFAGYHRWSYRSGAIIYMVFYIMFKCYFFPMLKYFNMQLIMESVGNKTGDMAAPGYPGNQGYPNNQQPYPNNQFPQQQYPPQYPNQQPYPNPQQPYPNVQQPYPNGQQPYPNAQQPYPQEQFPNNQQSFPNAQPYPTKY